MTRLRASFLQRALHFLDRRLAALVLDHLLVPRALRRRDLPDQSEIAPLELPRSELLRRQLRGTPAAPLAGHCRLRGWSPAAARCATATAAPQRLQPLLELTDFAITTHIR